jgi:GNAT superfamily N-acetyltransferase
MLHIIEKIDLYNPGHCENLVRLLDGYMRDEMGGGTPMPPGLGEKLIIELKSFCGYIGFLIKDGGHYCGIANCLVSFSTFKAMPVLNLHDFFIEKEYRGSGAGKTLIDFLIKYSRENGFAKMTLEVRVDNLRAQTLYRKFGFGKGPIKTFFWENDLNP